MNACRLTQIEPVCHVALMAGSSEQNSSGQARREAIIAAARAIIDEGGIDVLNLREVAKRLGIKAPSLYNHFASKAELLAAVARDLLRNAEMPPLEALEWREAMTQVALATRRVMLSHPHIAPLLLQFFPREVLLGAYDRAIRDLNAPITLAMVIVEATEKLTLGSALFAAAAKAAGKTAMPPFDADRFPHLAAAIDANPYDDEQVFVEAMRRVLNAFPDKAVED